jgi:hypothetical protein
MEVNKIIIVNSEAGKFAFTKDETNSLVYQEVGEVNQFYFSTDRNEGGNLSDDWEIVDMMSIDEEYRLMVERAIEEFKQEKA